MDLSTSTGVAGEPTTTISLVRGSAFAVLPADTVPKSAEVHVVDQLVESEAPKVQLDVQNGIYKDTTYPSTNRTHVNINISVNECKYVSI